MLGTKWQLIMSKKKSLGIVTKEYLLIFSRRTTTLYEIIGSKNFTSIIIFSYFPDTGVV